MLHVHFSDINTLINIFLCFLIYLLQYLSLPCGLIRGALANLGIPSIVGAEITTMPMCAYLILFSTHFSKNLLE